MLKFEDLKVGSVVRCKMSSNKEDCWYELVLKTGKYEKESGYYSCSTLDFENFETGNSLIVEEDQIIQPCELFKD